MAPPIVRRVTGGAVPQTVVATAAARLKPQDAELTAGMQLPTEPCLVSKDIKDYTFLIYAQPGWGKTTLLSTFPDVVLLPTERGFKGIPGIYTLGPSETGGTITSWEQFLRAVELLEASPDRFENVGVDTVNNARALCQKFVCQRAGVKHPGDRKDRGKLWSEVTEELLSALSRISATGRGLYMTSHVREDKVERSSGSDYTKIGPNLSPLTAKGLIAFVDFCFYGDYVGLSGAGVQRVMFTQGDELITSKARKQGSGVPLPEVIALPDQAHEEQDYEYLKAMFEGRLQGLDLSAVSESGQSSKAVQKKINQASMANTLANLQGREVPAQQ